MNQFETIQHLFRVWMLMGLVFAASCGVDDGDDDTAPTIINTEPDDEADADTSGSGREYAEVELCSVLVRFVFENGTGVEVQFENWNDATVIVEVENQTTGGITVKNCLWPDGEDNESAGFAKGDELLATVFIGEGDLLQYSCSELIGDAFGAFQFCDDMVVVIN